MLTSHWFPLKESKDNWILMKEGRWTFELQNNNQQNTGKVSFLRKDFAKNPFVLNTWFEAFFHFDEYAFSSNLIQI